MNKIRIYKTKSGEEPFTRWFSRFRDKVTKARIRRRIDRLQLGNKGDFKSVGNGVSELRLCFGPGYRVYYGKDGKSFIILLCAGDKSSQSRDIKLAHSYWNDYKNGDRNE